MKQPSLTKALPKSKGSGPRQEKMSVFIDLGIRRRGLDKCLAEIPGKT